MKRPLILSVSLVISGLSMTSCSTKFSQRFAEVEAQANPIAIEIAEKPSTDLMVAETTRTDSSQSAENSSAPAPVKKSEPTPAIVAEVPKKAAVSVKKAPEMKVASVAKPEPAPSAKPETKAEDKKADEFEPAPYFTLFTKTEDDSEIPADGELKTSDAGE